eukprot:TRINITY_DN2519_c0_g5_i2.p1 TRINITY_DN2519_c0_g5~~TRINITY_DN2519_c0_g5_i2.p1  ORF type:complete len:198 (-),score=26.98 TRINITY_DN2519_c0_g5_i2:187-735(-)
MCIRDRYMGPSCYTRSYRTFRTAKEERGENGREKEVVGKPKKSKKENREVKTITAKKEPSVHKQKTVHKPDPGKVLVDLLDFDNEAETVPTFSATLPDTLLEVDTAPHFAQEKFAPTPTQEDTKLSTEPAEETSKELDRPKTLLDDANEMIDLNNLMEVVSKKTNAEAVMDKLCDSLYEQKD